MKKPYGGILGAAAVLLLTTPVTAQVRDSCPGELTGDLGISSLGCAGEACRMVFSRRAEGGAEIWLYSTEPVVDGIRPGGPVDGILESGDRLVAVNDALITTRRGSEAFHLLEPGEIVRLKYRTGDGFVREATVEASARCDIGEGRRRAEQESGLRDSDPGASGRRSMAVDEGEPRPSSGVPAAGRPSRSATPGVRLGITFQCDHCVLRTTGDGGVRWSFSRPVEILHVDPAGPADRAGLRPGDLIRRIDGHMIESKEGAAAWGELEAGKPVRLLISRTNGSFGNVEIVPERAESGGVLVTSRSGVSRFIDEGTLQYTGVLGSTLVEVRGDTPVSVVDREDGILTIQVGGHMIRLRSAEPGQR